MKEILIRKIETRSTILGVIGLGYVGLPLVKEFLRGGFRVIGFDVDPRKIESLNQGKSYLKHIDGSFIGTAMADGRLEASGEFHRLAEADAIIICVPTPLGIHNEPDLSYVLDTTRVIQRFLRKGHVVVLESTTYPGTTSQEMLPILASTGLRVGEDFFLGYSPEREDPGNRQYNTGTIPKIVSGYTPACRAVVEALYASIIEQVFATPSTDVAEAAKLLENIYRAVNIALVNELKVVFADMNIDIWEVVRAASSKPFGFQPFYPGPGLGGHCIPIDPFYLTWKAREVGRHTRFIELAGEINTEMPAYVVQRTIDALNQREKSIKNARILVLGVAYKPDVDDTRESPSLRLIHLYRSYDAQVDYHDPFIPQLPPTRKYTFPLRSIDLQPETLRTYDAVVIATHHSCYDLEMIRSSAQLIIDTRNAMQAVELRGDKLWKA
jgi:UDP-N-acetyl-D-glucosamine dehydrogenase